MSTINDMTFRAPTCIYHTLYNLGQTGRLTMAVKPYFCQESVKITLRVKTKFGIVLNNLF